MSYHDPIFSSPSTEFIKICQSQLNLWGNRLKADWSAVYLMQGSAEDDLPLIPVAMYPVNSNDLDRDRYAIAADCTALALPSASSSPLGLAEPIPLGDRIMNNPYHQMILPLMYQETIFGLWVTQRKEKPWQGEDIEQGKKMAETLAIACFLDQRQHRYQRQLQQQYYLQQQQADHLDNLLHQLRNPLTALRTFSKLLLKRLGLDEKSQSIVEGIARESDRLQDLLVTFEQDWHRYPANPDLEQKVLPSSTPLLLASAQLPLETVELQELITPLLTSAVAIAESKQITIQTDLGEKKIFVKGNKKALREVFTNLLDNAIKYSPMGGKIAVSVVETKDDLGMAIADTGYGIPEEDKERIFERNYRGIQEESDIPGTGLGLAIVKAFIEQMGGTIEVISPNGFSQQYQGTTFIVKLPTAS